MAFIPDNSTKISSLEPRRRYVPRKTRKVMVGPAEDIERRAREREYRELIVQLRRERWQAAQNGKVRP